jgi:DNA-binding CsgD family transcriptional regulator
MFVDPVKMLAEAQERADTASLALNVITGLIAYRDEVTALGVPIQIVQHEFDEFDIRIYVGGVMPSSRCPGCRNSADPIIQADDVCADVPSKPEAVEAGGAVSKAVAAISDKAVPVVAPEPAPQAPDPEFVTGHWSEREVDQAHSMLDKGQTSSQIAKKLGRKPNSVSVYVAKLRKSRAAVKAGVAGPKVIKRKLVPATARALSAPAVAPEPAAVPAAAEAFATRRGVASVGLRAEPSGGDLLRSGMAGERPYAERAIIAHLNGLGHKDGWNAERDLELVEEICKGGNLDVIAAELQVGRDAAKARWKLLNSDIGDMGHQVLLVRMLRERANA